MNILCNGFPWWLILGLVLAILVIVLILVFDWLGIRTTLTTTRRFPRMCKLAGLLLGVYLAFFLAAILNQFLPTICRSKESIYFWKLAGFSQSGIVAKPVNSDRAPAEFTELNRQANCIACHTVSRSTKMIAAIGNNFNGQIEMMGLDGEKIDIPAIYGSYLSFSPDGTKLAFSANDKDIAILDVATKTVTPLLGASDPDVIETMPSWSGDGSTIAFVRPVSGDSGDLISVPTDIYTVDSRGGVSTLLPGASGDGFNYYPAYSPDGRWLAFTRHTTGNTTYAADQAEIYILPAKGGEAVRIAANDAADGTRLENVSNSWASWSPDSQYLTFSSKRNNEQYDIFITNIDDQGNSGKAVPLEGASDPVNFEHLPYWGEPPIPNIGKNLFNLWPWLIPLPLLLLLLLLGCKRPEPLKPTIKLERSISPDRGRIKRDLFKTTLDLIGDTSACEGIIDVRPVDVALVIDVSGSMGELSDSAKSATPLDSAKSAARLFLNRLDIGRDQVAIIPFDDQGRIAHNLDGDKSHIFSALDGLSVQGGTAIDQGLNVAFSVITGPERRPEAEPAVILLSDGGSADDPALIEAEKIKKESIRLITIGFGSQADQNLLSSLASTPQDFYYAPDGSKLADIYRSIAETMHKPVAATNIELTHTFDADNFELIRDSVIPTPKRIETGKIVWFFDHIGTTHRILSYKLKPRNIGEHDVDLGDYVSYLRCGKDLSNLSYGRDLKVTVLEPGIVLPPPQPRVYPLELTHPNVVWQPSNALIIGVGGTGRRIVTQVKKSLLDSGAGDLPDNIKLLVIDTSEYEKINRQQQDVKFAGVSISKEEVFVLDENLAPQIKNSSDGGIRDYEWFPYGNYSGYPTEKLQLSNGTNCERPLAHLGLILAYKKFEEVLKEYIKKAITKNEDGSQKVHIILAGSIAGGMSGILSDVAFMVQKLARDEYGENASIILEGYLVLSTGLPDQWVNDNSRKANSFATLRELQRYQLNPGMKYMMGYGSQATDDIIDQQLFSRVSLYDKGELRVSVDDLVASISDQITLRLDKAAGVVGPADWMNATDDLIDQEQKSKKEMVVRSAGSFTFRLPLLDIMNFLENKWARILITQFLGKHEELIVREKFFQDHPADTLTRLFLSDPNGLLNNEKNDENLVILQIINDLSSSEQNLELQSVISKIQQQDSEQITQSMGKALNSVAEITLSGKMDEVDAESDQYGRIGYWKGFLASLENQIETALNVLNNSNEQIKSLNQQQLTVLSERIGLIQKIVKEKKIQFSKVAESISSTRFGNQNGSRGLIESIDEVLNDFLNIKIEMENLKVRRYAWDRINGDSHQSFIDYLFEKYAIGERDPQRYVKYISWVTNPENGLGLELSVRSSDNNSTYSLYKAEDLEEFITGLRLLAKSVLKDARDDEGLELSNAFFGDVMPEVINYSRSLLRHNKPDVTKKFRIVAHPDSQAEIRKFPGLSAGLKMAGTNEMMSSTDKYSLSLLQTEEVIPLSAINDMKSLEDYYYDDLKNNNNRAVYLEESRAARFERNGQNNEKRLHPFVVAGLIDQERAEWFCLAYASGWINKDNEIIKIKINGSEYRLINEIRPSIDPLVEAFLRFCYGEPRDIALPEILDPDQQEVQRWRANWTTIPNNFTYNVSPELKSLGEFMQYYINRRTLEIAKKIKNEGR